MIKQCDILYDCNDFVFVYFTEVKYKTDANGDPNFLWSDTSPPT